ncbi:YqgE/AlgH family protein [Thermomonas hydrothermalis]|uniref:UPF0301 protein SAMN02745204_01339 n=1 Tax=Thermomonas hydrothermalis TaxID=213588 RepID=A0A1M4X5Z3_9GAMM|nr:YqgE/AlgH family protein [Thermomonas hydrothermalis]MCL6618760.1 YqgE/AlgH family protein [Thermomonas hydrothermalis]SHE88857.1 putative transcriptional regulator [Thermomonas hydrothermalis]
MQLPPANFTNHLLIALPSLRDPNFERTVTLICHHDDEGALGVIINQPSQVTVGDVLQHLGLSTDDPAVRDQPVLEGGPVHRERGFVIHDGDRRYDSSTQVGEGLYLTTSRDVMEAMAKGEGPPHALVALGCAGWGPGQLEQELVEDAWLLAPVRTDVLFELPLAQRWQAAAGSIGIDLLNHASHSGHA